MNEEKLKTVLEAVKTAIITELGLIQPVNAQTIIRTIR